MSFIRVYLVLGTMLGAGYLLLHLIYSLEQLRERCGDYCAHFTDGKTEAQIGLIICLGLKPMPRPFPSCCTGLITPRGREEMLNGWGSGLLTLQMVPYLRR